jgi:site-specific DNA-methyltransferase (adenine-specific)
MMAYLVMMTVRLVELRRVLKPTGSLYLHCDPTASHYLKVILDAIFGAQNFQNEIVWKRTSAHSSANRYGPVHDVLLFYSKSDEFSWNPQYEPYSEEYIASHYHLQDSDGRHFTQSDLTAAGTRWGSSGEPWRGFDPNTKGNHWKFTIEKLEELDVEGRIYWPSGKGWPRYKRYLDEQEGARVRDIWTDINPINAMAAERLGYPTPKPLALLERIVEASSNPGDWVLDPFCGCGTTVAAAQRLGRRWIGIDVTHLSITLQKYRLQEMFPEAAFRVIGEPQSVSGARQLAEDNRHQFEWWALSLVRARPTGAVGATRGGRPRGKKGADRGIDGVISFIDGPKGKAQRVVVQVKSGKVGVRDVRDLRGTVEREKAALGVLISLEPPTRDMETEAAAAGFYHSPVWQRDYPRLQVLTVEQLLAGARVEMPPDYGTFKRAERVVQVEEVQGRLEL